MSNQIDASVAKRYDITVKQNQTFDALLSFTDAGGAPISLLGATPKLSVRMQAGCEVDCGCAGDTPFDVVYKQDMLPIVTGASNNQLQFNDVIRLSDGNYKYDLLIEFPDGTQRYFLTGSFKVKKSYTKI